jgi:hypothetical protein
VDVQGLNQSTNNFQKSEIKFIGEVFKGKERISTMLNISYANDSKKPIYVNYFSILIDYNIINEYNIVTFNFYIYYLYLIIISLFNIFSYTNKIIS